ncbi:MAG: electron transport complex subunit RsxC, partial [Victivallales bacterium]|nr:electron transport complex subunit RsxC [Victivallales bacterium]
GGGMSVRLPVDAGRPLPERKSDWGDGIIMEVQKKKISGGVHPKDDGKSLSSGVAIKPAPLLEKYQVILCQHIGAPPKLIVNPGDVVKKGQMIAEPGGFVSAPVHAPTSGTVGKVIDVPGPMGVNQQAVEILADGKDEFDSGLEPIADWRQAAPEVLKERIGKAGIVGMGGAAFPTLVKLSPPPAKKIDTLILNGAECEPYLTADHRLMLERADAVLTGAAIMARVLGITRIYIGIEANKPNAIAELQTKAPNYNAKVVVLKVRYPQGGEKQLIYAVTGRKVPEGMLPMDAGCVVQNVGTAAAVAEAVLEGKPLFERVTTVTGLPVVNPGNWLVRIGTPIAEVLRLAGGVKSTPGKVILGGPMMGFAQKSIEVPVMKNTSGILLLDQSEVVQFTSQPCIRCGKCIDNCPMNLLCGTISCFIENEKFDKAEELHVMDCLECGACAYACPAHRPLVQHVRRAKAEIRARKAKENKK